MKELETFDVSEVGRYAIPTHGGYMSDMLHSMKTYFMIMDLMRHISTRGYTNILEKWVFFFG